VTRVIDNVGAAEVDKPVKPRSALRFLAYAAVLLASVMLAILVVELGLRLTHYGEDNLIHLEKFVEYDPGLGWRHKRNFSSEFVNDETHTTLQFNANGWSGPVRPYAKPPGVTRIVVLGGSFVDGYSVRTEDRLTEVMEANLGPKFEVINLGVVGYGTDQALLLLEQEGLKYQPDLIVLAFSYNDVWRNGSRFFANTNRRVQKPLFVADAAGNLTLTNIPVPLPLPTAQERWKVYSLVRTVVKGNPLLHGMAMKAGMADTTGFIWGEEFPVYRRAESPAFAQSWAITQDLLRKMKQEAQQRGIGFVVFYIPPRIELSAEEWGGAHLPADYDPGKVAGRLGAICQTEGIPYIDPSSRYKEAARQGPLFYSRDTHWNPAGHHLAGEILTEYVQSNLQSASQ
jgi:SGNH hydrolase-like domain, acetyltransferase AlgX